MSYFLVICFIILVVCIVLQTIFFYQERKESKEFNPCSNCEYVSTPFIKIYPYNNDDNEVFVAKDCIVGLAISKKDSDIYVVINCVDTKDYIEQYDDYNEACKRIDELLENI